MENKDIIKDLFSEKLNGFEANVRPELWANISSQIGSVATTTAATTSLSILTKTIIGISIAASVGTVAFFTLRKDDAKSSSNVTPVETKTNEELNTRITPVKDIDKSQKNVNDAAQTEMNSSNNEESIFEFPIRVSVLNETPVFVENNNPEKIIPTPIINEEATKDLPKEAIKSNPEIIKETQNAPIEQNESQTEVEIANVFTPNGDGTNDFLTIKSEGLTNFSIVILDQASKILFQSSQSDFSWDGRGMNGEIVASGNYVYYLTAQDAKGKTIKKYGVLAINP